MLQPLFLKTSGLAGFSLAETHETVVVMPSIDMDLAAKAARVMTERTEQNGLLIVAEDDLRLGFIMTANMVYAKTRSTYFAYTAQDAFAGQFWLDYGLHSLRTAGGGLLSFNDGRFFGKIAAFGLAERAWLQSVYGNLLFYPEYKKHFADTELSVIALHATKLVYNPNSILVEADYDKNHGKCDPEDEALYFRRAATGFGGLMPPFTPEKPQQ